MCHVHLFLSCVTNELGTYRTELQKGLSRKNVTVKIQEDFIASGTLTLDKLDDYIRSCDAVIHIVGLLTGSMAQADSVSVINSRYPDMKRKFSLLEGAFSGQETFSYTQWEAYLAAYHSKVLIIATPDPTLRRDTRYVADPEQEILQSKHLDRLKSMEHHVEIRFSNVDQLKAEVTRSSVFDIITRCRVRRILKISAVTFALFMLTGIAIWQYYNSKKPVLNTVVAAPLFDSVLYNKTQNYFSINTIELEEQAIDMLIDSQTITKDWVNWFGSEPHLLVNATSILDTLTALKKQYHINYNAFDSQLYQNLAFTTSYNGKELKHKETTFSKQLLVGTSPNIIPEFSFTTNLLNAKSIFGFDVDCIKKGKDGGFEQNDCQKQLTIQSLDWLLQNYQLREKVGEYGESWIHTPNSLIFLQLYKRVLQDRMPDNFIVLHNRNEGDCDFYPESLIKIAYSTPVMKVRMLVIKNISDNAINIGDLKFIVSTSKYLRQRKDDAILTGTNYSLHQPMKLTAGQEIVIPVSITFTPIADVKTLGGTVGLTGKETPWIYGAAYYLDTINVNGLNYVIKQKSKSQSLTAKYEGKIYIYEGSCPYLYAYSDKENRYNVQKQFLYMVNGKAKERYDTVLIKDMNANMLINEVEEENSYIDQLFFMERTISNKIIFHKVDNQKLQQLDQQYIHLTRGDKLKLHIKKFSKNNNSRYYLISEGYYIPKVRNYKKYHAPEHVFP